MEVAPEAELERGINFFPQLIEQARKVGAIIGVAIVGVGSSDGVRNAVSNCHPAHFDGYFPGLGPVVNFGQNVAVDVDQGVIFSRS